GLLFDGGLAQILGIYELPVQDALARFVRPGCVVYDVGGHRGFFALLLARLVGPQGRVFVFEPLEENRLDAEDATRRNGFSATVEILPAAVGGEEGEAELFVGEATTVATLVTKAGGTARRVPQTTLDAFARRHTQPSVLKIDVEGYEAEVLIGATEVLATARPLLVVEVHDPEVDSRCREILAGHRYRCSRLATRSSRVSTYPHHLLAAPEDTAA
ncbi:MAG: FkbM family methyltransferase, partial [Thermoanaerobaculia bacterium]|nr:FkbM family methyltransferase [Thermoanaerobaculia bacterium]